jgi:hypothetical protein
VPAQTFARRIRRGPVQHPTRPRGLDIQALFVALDDRRCLERLSWMQVAGNMWQLSADLNAQREDHPISAATISKMPRRGDKTCQHALVMLRWLERAPEEFIVEPHPDTAWVPLPEADPAHRLRWDLAALYRALNDARTARAASWEETAGACTAAHTSSPACAPQSTPRACD